jgi:hypothetical protein
MFLDNCIHFEVQKYFPAQQVLVFHYVNCNNACVKRLEEPINLHNVYGCILQLYIIQMGE